MYAEYTYWTTLVYDKIHNWLIGAVKMLPNAIVALLALLLFLFLARLLKKLSQRVIFRISGAKAVSGLFANIIYMLVVFIGLFIALDVLRLEKTVSSLLAGAGIIGLALGFAFQDLTANFISGIFITFRKPFEVGHLIETNGFTGTVEDIQLRSTTLRTSDGLHVLIPNKDIFQKPIINHSLTPERRLSITFNAPVNNEQTPLVQEVVMQALHDIPHVSTYKPCTVLFSNIDGANVKVTVSCWIANDDVHTYDQTQHAIISKLVMVIKNNKFV